MTDARAIAGDFADIRTVKSRSVVQLIIELPIEQGETVVKLFGFPQPGSPTKLAVARLVEAKQIESEVVPDTARPSTGQNKTQAGEKREWSSLSPAQQAGMRCTEPAFQLFLREQGDASCTDANKAAEYVRFVCGVKSRADIGKSNAAIAKWRDLDERFRAWKQLPEVVA